MSSTPESRMRGTDGVRFDLGSLGKLDLAAGTEGATGCGATGAAAAGSAGGIMTTGGATKAAGGGGPDGPPPTSWT